MTSDFAQVPYISSPYAQTHPSRLFVLGRLAGLDTPPVEQCRVLEIGTNQGENLIGMAIVLPSAEFVGIDLAEFPVALGQKTISDLGLQNIRLLQMDLLDIDPSFGQFDYIIAHGVYSWAPPGARDKILAIAAANLSPNGVAYVSYNAYPGRYIRTMLREMMLYRIGNEAAPKRKLTAARELLQVIADARPSPDSLNAMMASQAVEMLAHTDSALLHDDLSDAYQPVYFHEFAAHAARHNLQYLGPARIGDSTPRNLTQEAIAKIQEMANGDRIAEEQYLDFARTQRFKESLLCHAAIQLSEGSLEGCYASSAAIETPDGGFENSGISMTTTHPAPVEYLRRLISISPLSERIAAADRGLATELYRIGILDIAAFPGVARAPGQRPFASLLARYQAARGDGRVTTLDHRPLELNHNAVKLVALLDGSRTRDELARELGCPHEELEGVLDLFAKHALFTG